MRILFYMIIIISLASCMCNNKTYIANCGIYLPGNSDNPSISNYLENTLEDSLWKKEFIIEVKNNSSFSLKDIKNKWENEYSSDYFDVIIEYFTNEYVLIYCPRSGIQAGYKLFSKKEHDVYLIDRKDGHCIKSIEIKRGLVNGIIFKKAIFLKFIDPEEIRRCEF